MDRSVIEKIEAMAEVKIIEVDDRPYSTKQLHPVYQPKPAALTIHTLSGLVDYLTSNPDGLEKDKLLVHILGANEVNVYSSLHEQFNQRAGYVSAVRATSRSFCFGQFYGVEEFIIALQSQFVPDETTANILKIVGNIKDGEVKTFSDDGTTQEVKARAGVVMVEGVQVPNPVSLAPYRTFAEVTQPVSRFVLRVKSGDTQPKCALFEADGGAWELDAIESIRDWLKDNVKDITILA